MGMALWLGPIIAFLRVRRSWKMLGSRLPLLSVSATGAGRLSLEAGEHCAHSTLDC